MKYSNIYKCTTADGPGVRVSIYFSGCLPNKMGNEHCRNCHNQALHSFNYGSLYTEKVHKSLVDLVNKEYISGLTICGGEPLDQDIIQLIELAYDIKKLNKSVWCYSGYTWPKILELIHEKPLLMQFLLNVDALVINPFIDVLRDITSKNPWRGSTNQRIINPRESILQNKIVFVEGILNNE